MAIYLIPAMMACGTVIMILAGWWFSRSWGEGPFAQALGQTLARGSLLLMNLLQTVVLSYLTVSSLYFAASLLAMALHIDSSIACRAAPTNSKRQGINRVDDVARANF